MYCVGALNINKSHYNITFKKAIDIKQDQQRNCITFFYFDSK